MEEMEVNYVDDIHEKLTDMVGDRVKVKANMGRTRVVERMGTIKSVHPAVFIVEVDERRGRKSRQSYQYIDVLTGQVHLFDPDSGAHILAPPGKQPARHSRRPIGPSSLLRRQRLTSTWGFIPSAIPAATTKSIP